MVDVADGGGASGNPYLVGDASSTAFATSHANFYSNSKGTDLHIYADGLTDFDPYADSHTHCHPYVNCYANSHAQSNPNSN